MATNLNKEKFDILNFINGYIVSICGNCHKRIRNLLKDFSIKISSSAEGRIRMLGIEGESNIRPIGSYANGRISMLGIEGESNAWIPSSSAKGCIGMLEVKEESDIGPISSSAVGLIVQE